ncbi:ribosomal-protein-L7/L12-serine acetyltransferase [Streptomyces sp. YIM 121038]|uniref:GNAT family N-acetyltransferase n=1 Tax=Streptomyces sp. YIM 121038 TaxID=2136401 RepID=UPI0011107A86|nr:GNAT family N-acetyltransferase [Streptomyces sp. YIM 121038]QCX78015.1 ribosomal-protein-L7/L12-serine acetyltransferase [Streptomyces sp. YIM 121038]
MQPPVTLRPWRTADAASLVEIYRDAALRRWALRGPEDEAAAVRWIEDHERAREAGDRFAFAVTEPSAEDRVLGQVVLKREGPDPASAEVGYWTAAPARGRGVAPRALEALTEWAFTTFAAEGLTRLSLLHQVDNEASCRVAHKCGYDLAEVLAPFPPDYPLSGHRHVRERVA